MGQNKTEMTIQRNPSITSVIQQFFLEILGKVWRKEYYGIIIEDKKKSLSFRNNMNANQENTTDSV